MTTPPAAISQVRVRRAFTRTPLCSLRLSQLSPANPRTHGERTQMALRKLIVPFFSEVAAVRLRSSWTSRSMCSSASLRHVVVDPPSSERPVRPIPAFDPRCAPHGEEFVKIISNIRAVDWTNFEKEALQDEVLKATGGMDIHLIVSGLDSGRFTTSEYLYLGLQLNKRFPHLSSLLEIELNGKTAFIPPALIEALQKEPQVTRIEFTQPRDKLRSSNWLAAIGALFPFTEWMIKIFM
uniref:Uncharacterized protein n=1 Tax=Oryza punctata TaxID=4537 RepID=A0A0E0LZB8_ORYPU